MASIRVQRLLDIEQRALSLSQKVLPNVNWGASFISAEGATVLNNFECALRRRGETELVNEWGMMCDPYIADDVVDKIKVTLVGEESGFQDVVIKYTVCEVPVYINIFFTGEDNGRRLITLCERDNGVMGSRVYGCATVKLETLREWTREWEDEDA